MDQDAKIRDYVLKKQQQKERASMLRAQRRNQRATSDAQQGNKGYGGNQNPYARPQPSRKIIGDPFANINDQRDDDMRSHGGRSQHNNAPMNSGKATWNNDFGGDAYNDAPQSGYGHQQQRGGGGNSGFNSGLQNQNVNPNANGNVDDDEYADFDTSNQGGGDNFGRGDRGGPTNQNSFGRGNGGNPNQGGGGGGFGGGPSRSRGNVQQSVKRHGQQSRFGRRTSTVNNHNGNGNGNGNRRRSGAVRQQFASSADQNQIEPMQRMERSQSSEDMLYGGNSAQFATTGDVKKVLSMVEQLRGQMHALQFQIDAVKTENVRLTTLVAELEDAQSKQQAAMDQLGSLPRVRNEMDIDNVSVGGVGGGGGMANRANRGRISKNLRNLKGKRQGPPQGPPQGHGAYGDSGNNGNSNGFEMAPNQSHGAREPNEFQQNQGFPANSHRGGGGQMAQGHAQIGFDNGFRGNGGGGNGGNGGMGMSDEFFSGNNGGQPPQNYSSSRRNSQQPPQQQRQSSIPIRPQQPQQGRSGAGMGHRQQSRPLQPAQQQYGGGDDEDEEDIAAPPKSSAADIIAKLEAQQGAFGGMGMDDGQPPPNVERVACAQCGRKFAPAALARHTKICAKVFCQKRKAYKAPLVDDEARKAARSTDQAAVEKELARKRELAKKKWKAQSSMLRNAVRTSKQIEEALKAGKSLKDLPTMQTIPVEDDRVPCPHCGRKFAEETAKRHIPKCQNMKARPKMLRRKR